MPSRRPRSGALATLALGLAAALTLTACSGGSTTISDTLATTTTQAPEVTTTTQAPTPVTVTTTSTAPTTTTVPIVAQLTGHLVAEEITRPAAVVKIDNHVGAQRQWGLNDADIVYEELAEGKITRFAAVFHSNDVERIGPVRSARTGDFDLLTNLNTPLFVISGANNTVSRLLYNVDAVRVTDGGSIAGDAIKRTRDQVAPHNLITSTELIYGGTEGHGDTPPALFNYGGTNSFPPGSQPVRGVDLDFGANSLAVSYRWSDELRGWAREQRGRAHMSDSRQIAPTNVIIQFVNYRQSVADRATPEPQLVGSGEAIVLVGGRAINASWSRVTSRSRTIFVDERGNEIMLRPGNTWIALTREGRAELVPHEAVPQPT